MDKHFGKINITPKIENIHPVSSVEKTANYEGDNTLLFLERLNNPEVNAKLVDSMTREYIYRYFRPGVEVSEAKTQSIKEEQAKRLRERIDKVFNSTEIDLNEKRGTGWGKLNETGTICPDSINIENGELHSKKELNIYEAHEKGHGVRTFNEKSPVGAWVQNSLDFSNVSVHEEDMIVFKKFLNKFRETPYSDKEVVELCMKYNKQPTEIVERMSQLKNYFGMKGNELFTKEHLDYARKNYMKDIWSAQIRFFFDSITDKTEKNFLDVINNFGV